MGVSNFRLPGTAMISDLNLNSAAHAVDFPQFFPQVWKTLGRDQRRHGCLFVQSRSEVLERGRRL